MITQYRKNDVVQFIENHEWVGCIGIVSDVKKCDKDYRYLIGVPVPQRGTAFIFSMESAKEFEYIGRAVLGEPEDKEEVEE